MWHLEEGGAILRAPRLVIACWWFIIIIIIALIIVSIVIIRLRYRALMIIMMTALSLFDHITGAARSARGQ